VKGDRGFVLLATFVMMLVLIGLALAAGIAAQNSVVIGRSTLQDQQAFYVAEAGWQRARQAVTAGTWTAGVAPDNAQYTESFGAGQYQVTVTDNGDSTYTVSAEGYVPNQTTVLAKRKVVETAIPVTISGGIITLGRGAVTTQW